ncbi:hypothetical protein CLV80_10229 [Yoonia maritima]|uniref:Lipoprotein n=1 Tax=Yoonia maritima TaxID=1435347 RepID=A0A2T0W2K7_9RHOB|nr:hypothetical protein [Yoonia maritima]PRY79386.1 hypothetical protein CLV80_10229 [Yoonia maritima]
MKIVIAFLTGASVLGLTACAGQDPMKSYPQAETVRECQVLHAAESDQARQNVRNTQYTSSGGNALGTLIGTAIGKGIGEGVLNNRLQGCIARVGGASPAGGATYTSSIGSASSSYSGSSAGYQPAIGGSQCKRGAGPFQGGGALCPGS